MSLLLLLPIGCTPAVAAEVWEDGTMRQPGYSKSRTCYKSVYKEEYVPGTELDPGYVKTSKETIEVPCKDNPESLRSGGYTRKTTIEYDNNDCSDGKIAGGLVGGGIGAAISRGDGRWWAIPLGAVLGSRIGCEVEGG